MTLQTVARQAPLSMGFSRQEHEWVAMPFSRGSYRHRDQTHVTHHMQWQVGSLPLVLPEKSNGSINSKMLMRQTQRRPRRAQDTLTPEPYWSGLLSLQYHRPPQLSSSSQEYPGTP